MTSNQKQHYFPLFSNFIHIFQGYTKPLWSCSSLYTIYSNLTILSTPLLKAKLQVVLFFHFFQIDSIFLQLYKAKVVLFLLTYHIWKLVTNIISSQRACAIILPFFPFCSDLFQALKSEKRLALAYIPMARELTTQLGHSALFNAFYCIQHALF